MSDADAAQLERIRGAPQDERRAHSEHAKQRLRDAGPAAADESA